MAKKLEKMLAILLALSMCMSLLSFQALAADGTETTINPDGTTTVTTTTTTETTGDNGNVTVVVTIEKDTDGTIQDSNTVDGVTVDKDELRTETTVKDENGKQLDYSWVEEGTEIKEWTEADSGDSAGQPSVTVDLKPGKTTTGTAEESTTVTDETGTTTTTTTDRTVTATTSEVKVTVNETSSDLTPVTSEDNADGSPKLDEYYDKTHYHYDKTLAGKLTVDYENMPDEADYAFVGFAEYSHKYATVLKVYYEKDEEGNIKYDENGEPMIDHLTRAWNDITLTDSDGNTIKTLDYPFTTGTRPAMFWLKNEDGEYVSAYCTDVVTGTEDGEWYSVSNLEDSNYYSKEDATHIRSVVSNGYWGSQEGTGSLTNVVSNLKAAIESGAIEDKVVSTEKDEEGNDVEIYLSDIIGNMTEGEALDATQAAIWSFANKEESDKIVFTGVIEGKTRPTAESAARREAFYNWLLSLTPTEAETVVINDKNFVDDFSLTVGNKIDETSVADSDGNVTTNGIYEAALNFKLAFTPSTENKDDLLVHISYTDLNGNPVIVTKRLAGAAAEGESFGSITPDSDGNYTIEGLKLSENEEFTFDLKLEGTQYLEQGAYFYAPVGGRDVSQSMVGLAEGTKTVDVSMSVTVSFDVDENNQICATRTWRDEGPDYYGDDDDDDDDDIVIGDDDDDDDDDGTELGDDDVPLTELPEGDVPQSDIHEENVPLADAEQEEIVDMIDEEVPLAEVPATGDSSALWLMLTALSGSGLVGLKLFEKKREEELNQ